MYSTCWSKSYGLVEYQQRGHAKENGSYLRHDMQGQAVKL